MTLNGIWKCHITDNGEHTYDIDGHVPGCAHTDLIKAGILPDLYRRTNNDCAGWVEACSVTYSRTFTLDAVEENTYINFEGLDTYGEVFLNGIKLGDCDDMFITWSYKIDGAVKVGENLIEVRFRSPVKEVEGLPLRIGAFTKERIYTRRMQCTYGWDWVARFVTMGIWRDVNIEVRRRDRFEGVYVYTESVNDYCAKVGIVAEFSDITGEGMADITVTDPDGKAVFKRSRRIIPNIKGASDTAIREYADIPDARLWYPVGYGEHPLYTFKLSVGEEILKEFKFGIRTVEIIEIEDKPGSPEAKLAEKLKKYPQLVEWDRNETSSCFTLLVNGVKVFCAGANYVPCEPFPSDATAEKFEKLAALAEYGGYNMLRVWGGGIFENDEFYSACDRHGIMVTQDFLMACGAYPEEYDDFIEKLKLETEHAAMCLRNHTCLVWWSGDNENAIKGDINNPDYRGRRAALEGIGPILERLDPKRRFLPSSPYGGVPYASGVRGTTHNTQYLNHVFNYIEKSDFSDYREFFDSFLSRFCTEQGVMGMPYVSSLRRFMTDDDIFGDDTSVSEYHTKSNPALKISLYGYIERITRSLIGDWKNGYERTENMQKLQCERVRMTLELYRRNAWYSSGMIYWMYNDCWPAANSWSHVDYYGAPKPAFYSFKRCAKPFVASITERDGKLVVYASHAGCGGAAGVGRLYSYNTVSGEEKWEKNLSFDVANGSEIIFEADISDFVGLLDRETVLIFDTEYDRAYFHLYAPAEMNFGSGKFVVVSEDADSITVRADGCVPVLLLDVPYLLSDNSFFMKSGEVRTLRKVQKL